MSPHDKNKQCVQLMGFYCNLCCFVAKSVIHTVLSQNLICHNSRRSDVLYLVKGNNVATFSSPRLYFSENVYYTNTDIIMNRNWQ